MSNTKFCKYAELIYLQKIKLKGDDNMDKSPEITEEKLLIWSQKLSATVIESISIPENSNFLGNLKQEEAIEENLLESCILYQIKVHGFTLDETTILPAVLKFLSDSKYVENVFKNLNHGDIVRLPFTAYDMASREVKEYVFERLIYRLKEYIEHLKECSKEREEQSPTKSETKFW